MWTSTCDRITESLCSSWTNTFPSMSTLAFANSLPFSTSWMRTWQSSVNFKRRPHIRKALGRPTWSTIPFAPLASRARANGLHATASRNLRIMIPRLRQTFPRIPRRHRVRSLRFHRPHLLPFHRHPARHPRRRRHRRRHRPHPNPIHPHLRLHLASSSVPGFPMGSPLQRGHQSGWVWKLLCGHGSGARCIRGAAEARVHTKHRAPGPRSRHRMFREPRQQLLWWRLLFGCVESHESVPRKHGCKRRRSVVLSSIGSSHAYVWGLSIAEQILVLFRN